MAVPKQTVSVTFGNGVDTKTNPKIASSPVEMRDCIFTQPSKIEKRNGHTNIDLSILGGGTISSPTMFSSYKNEGLIAGSSTYGPRLFSRSTSLSKWVDKGSYQSVNVSKKVIVSPDLSFPAPNSLGVGIYNSSSAILGSIVLFAYEAAPSSSNTPETTVTYFIAYDSSTGSVIQGPTVLGVGTGFGWGFSKVVALGSTCFGVFYCTSTSSGVGSTNANLCVKTVTVNTSGVTVGSEVQIGSLYFNNGYKYDVQSTSTGALVLLASNTPSVVAYTVDTTGAVTNGPVAVGTPGAGAISVCTAQIDNAGTNVWVYWIVSGTLNYAILNSSNASVSLVETTILVIPKTDNHLAVQVISNSHQNIMYSSIDNLQSYGLYTNGIYYPSIFGAVMDNTGATIQTEIIKIGLDIYAKPFTIGSRTYLPCISYSNTNPVGVILDISENIDSIHAVAKFLVAESEGFYLKGFNLTGSAYSAPSVLSMRWPGFIPSPVYLSSTNIGYSFGFASDTQEKILTNTGNLAASDVLAIIRVKLGLCLSSFDFSHANSYQSEIHQNTLALNGGIVQQYDGISVTELGYTIDPDSVSVLASNAGGVLGTGTFVYYVVYEVTDGNGNLHLSAPSTAMRVSFNAGAVNKVTINFAPLNVTEKTSAAVRIYRTKADQTTPYLLTTITNDSNNPLHWSSVAYTDNVTPDASLALQPTLYTEGGSVLENIAPPPAMILWKHFNRLWCVDSENPSTNIEYSKTASNGVGISFSTGQLEVIVDSAGGDIAGASGMDEKTVILKKESPAYFVGDGADDSGNGSQIQPLQIIPYDAGCVNSKSVILFPKGVMFKSPKGIYLVDRGASVSYLGKGVESYNSQDITSAVIAYNKNQIRFTTSSGYNLFYDYEYNKWSVFTSPTGLSADNFQNLYTYVTTTGSLYQENTTSFLDDTTAYAVYVKLFWIKAASIQNFQRVRRAELLGDYSNGSSASHGVQISCAYDFGTTFSTPIGYTFGAQSSSGPFEYRETFVQQKCGSIQLLIQEVTTGQSGEFISLTDLGLEIGAKRGLNRLPASQSV